MKILFVSTQSYTKEDVIWQEIFLTELPEAEFLFWPDTNENLSNIDYVVTWKPPHGLLKKCTELKAILSLAAGVDALLQDPELPEVPIVRLVDPYLTQGMVEFVLHWVLHYHRDFDHCIKWQKQKHWGTLAQRNPSERKVGIMGLGELGGHAARCLTKLNFDVAGWSRSQKNIPNVKSFWGDNKLTSFLNRTEILVCLLPLTKKTEGIIRKETLSALPPNAVLINAGRGEHMVPEDILEALDKGRLRAAVLDVFPNEPLPQTSLFWDHPNVVVTPHAASQTIPKSAVKIMVESIRSIEAGDNPINMINKELEY